MHRSGQLGRRRRRPLTGPSQRPGQHGGEAPGQQAGVHGTSDGGIEGHLGHHVGADDVLDVATAQGPAGLDHQDDARRSQRGSDEAAQRQVARPGHEQVGRHCRGHQPRGGRPGAGSPAAVAPAADEAPSLVVDPGPTTSKVPQSMTTERVSASSASTSAARSGGVSGPAPRGTRARRSTTGTSSRASASGGTEAPGPEPTGEAGAGGLGQAQDGGQITAQVDEQRAVGTRPGQDETQRRGDHRGPRTALDRPARSEHGPRPSLDEPSLSRGREQDRSRGARRSSRVRSTPLGQTRSWGQAGRSEPAGRWPSPVCSPHGGRLLRPRQDGHRQGLHGRLRPPAATGPA